MLLSELSESVVDLHQYLQELLEDIKGLLFLGDITIGNSIKNFVWITEIDNDEAIFPVKIEALDEIWTDSVGSTKLKLGRDFFIKSDRRTIVFNTNKDKFKFIGKYYLFFIPSAKKASKKLWKVYGRHLTELYREDSYTYKLLLEALLGYFILGPTEESIDFFFNHLVADNFEVGDYLTKPYWWVGKVLPRWILYPESDDTLKRYCAPTHLIHYGQYPIVFGGPKLNGKYYFYGGKSSACIYMDSIGKYHLFFIESNWETFSKLTKDKYMWKAFYNGLLEGKLTSAYPLIYTKKVIKNTIKNFIKRDPSLLDIDIKLGNNFTDGFSFGDFGLFYGVEKYYKSLLNVFPRAIKEIENVIYYFGENRIFDGTSYFGLNRKITIEVKLFRSKDNYRIPFFNDKDIYFGKSSLAYGVLSKVSVVLRPAFQFGEANIAVDYGAISGLLNLRNSYRFTSIKDKNSVDLNISLKTDYNLPIDSIKNIVGYIRKLSIYNLRYITNYTRIQGILQLKDTINTPKENLGTSILQDINLDFYFGLVFAKSKIFSIPAQQTITYQPFKQYTTSNRIYFAGVVKTVQKFSIPVDTTQNITISSPTAAVGVVRLDNKTYIGGTIVTGIHTTINTNTTPFRYVYSSNSNIYIAGVINSGYKISIPHDQTQQVSIPIPTNLYLIGKSDNQFYVGGTVSTGITFSIKANKSQLGTSWGIKSVNVNVNNSLYVGGFVKNTQFTSIPADNNQVINIQKPTQVIKNSHSNNNIYAGGFIITGLDISIPANNTQLGANWYSVSQNIRLSNVFYAGGLATIAQKIKIPASKS